MAEQTTPTIGDVLDFEGRFCGPLEARVKEMSETWPLPGKVLRNSVVGQVIDRIEEVFSTPVYKVLAAAWRKHPACLAFCVPGSHPPGEAQTLQLASHSLGWECEPAVEVLAEGLAAAGVGQLASLDFQVDLKIGVRAGLLTIQDARFMRMDAVELTIGGTLRVEAFEIARYEAPLRIPGTLRFGEAGEPICPPPEPAALSAAPAQVAVPRIVDPAQV